MKILVIDNTMQNVWFRRFFLRALLTRGHDVVAVAPFDGWEQRVQELGFRSLNVRMSRRGVNPWREWTTLWDLYRTIRGERPHRVILYTVKPTIYGTLAARSAGAVRIFSVVTGLGYTFVGNSTISRLQQSVLRCLYKMAFALNQRVVFQNIQDLEGFVHRGIVPRRKTLRVPGSGVDIEHFRNGDTQGQAGHFLLASRMLWDKGVGLYVNAARNLKKRYPNATFTLLGSPDDNPSSIPKDTLEQWSSEGYVEYLQFTADIRGPLARCSVYVLPTYYREGIPRTILEAMSMGKAIITTDTPGCRETVESGVNGFIIPPRDEGALVKTMEGFLKDPELAQNMGSASRNMAVEKFRLELVSNAMIAELEKDSLVNTDRQDFVKPSTSP